MKLRTPVGTRHFLCPVCQGPLSECWSSESAVIDYEGGAQKVALAAILRAEQLEARNAKLEAVAVAAQILASREGKDGWCDDCGYRGHLAPCPWRALDAALDALDD